ncbi:hypothetical protein DEF23_23800 [Marinitenerispora sediminis]|uniref:Alpha/beta hydrolase n=1 Tax=Marinitenerispora sediminis TaxID=1931232 RepID=A0A368T5M8_9ACTN|nr:hypothetical protein DEF28_24140 [Marinitenerispora sediminis]RCV49350.1 hypothetical protein DEF23_23800 [Marinitenerispora sediminis]RCV58687.1 hypothetical protein DEF24_12680 [Marinitenerispora sediminis]
MLSTALAAVLLPAAATAASAAEAPEPAADRAAPGLDWGACEGLDADTGMECASLRVPVDWDRPRGRQITLVLGRLPATGQAEGTVLVNPGGPIGAANWYLTEYGEPFAGLRETRDIVTWDLRGGPMGGGMSTTLDCTWTSTRQPEVPRDQAAFADLAAANRAVADECRDNDPALFDNMDSASHARDMEAIRRALGEERLTLHMTSYGGFLGQAYARLFPDRVRTLYLDGVPNHDSDALYVQMAADGEAAFDRFVDWCAAEEACALHDRDVPDAWQELVAAANTEPIPLSVADGAYTGRHLQDAAWGVLVSARPGDAWLRLAEAVVAAENGDASGFVADPRNPYPSIPGPGVVECLDLPRPRDHADLAATLGEIQRAAPNMGGRLQGLGGVLSCVGWPTPVTNPPAPLPEGLPPLLGVGTWMDGASTERVVQQVPGSVMVRRDGPGHGLYWNGDACVVEHADRYLLTGELPPAGTEC